MRTLTTFALLAALAATTEAKTPAGPPPELMATVAITTGGGLQPLRELADAVKPGAGAMLTEAVVKTVAANAIHATGLDGIDVSGWAYVVVADGGDVGLLGKVVDAKQLAASIGGATMLARDHWAFVGPKRVVDTLGAYALDVLAKQATPAAPVAIIYVPNVLARYRSRLGDVETAIAANAKGPSAELVKQYFDATLAMATDTQQIAIGLESGAATATLDIALAPIAGSRLAKFVGVQKASTFGLLDKLPPTQASMLCAGHLEAGPYHDGLIEMMMKMYSASVGGELGTAITAIMKASTGELAMAGDMHPSTGLAVTQVFSLDDPKSADVAIGHLLDTFKTARSFEVMGYTTTFKALTGVPAHDGVVIRGYEMTYDFSKLPPDQQKTLKALLPPTVSSRVALFDGIASFVMGTKADAETGLAIDAARGKSPHFVPPRPVADLLATARARKDSLAFVIDFAAVLSAFGQRPALPGASAPGVIALGFADRRFHVRMSLPFATLKSLAHP